MKIACLVPSLNAGKIWFEVLSSIKSQNDNTIIKILLDSGSNDKTVELAKDFGFSVQIIDKKDFDHGYARQLLADAAGDVDVLVYLTQDAILANENALSNLIKAFDDPKVGIAYGRQLPHKGAKVLETHGRLFNYTAISKVKQFSDKDKLGIRTASCSNSFAAYRKTALVELGGFPSHTIFGEDVIVGGQMLIKGWKIAYVADAMVYHSHDYTIKEEFKRYFDIGVFHSTNKWLIENFGSAGGEGLKYLISELKYVLKHNPLLIFKMGFSVGAKFLGYKLGMAHEKLTLRQCKSFTMHKKYWEKIEKTK